MSTLPERIDSWIDRSGDCWIWTGYRDKDGYGRVWYGTNTRPAHRVVYELLIGSIPDGLLLCHKNCPRSCVNPKHLELNSAKQRVGYMIETGRACADMMRGQSDVCELGHPYSRKSSGARFCRTCLNAYNRENYPAKKSKVREQRRAARRRYYLKHGR